MTYIHPDFNSIASTKALKEKITKYYKWEQKMMAKGWSFVRVMKETVPTWVFASPKRRKEIEAQNDAFYKRHQIKRTK